MFDHVTIRARDGAASERFYDTVLGAIGVGKTAAAEWDDFGLYQADTPTTGLHVGFCAWSHDDVDRFWQTGVDAGYQSDGEPGMRKQYLDDYYGAFLLDPDGNSVEAVYHGEMEPQGNIDHLWIRVADLDACRKFYELIAPYSGFELVSQPPGRVHFNGSGSSFALVSDSRPRVQNLHLAFGTNSNQTVKAFHEAATAAGYTDNGSPGERSVYHAGYFGAFVLDPAGTNVEVVNHNR